MSKTVGSLPSLVQGVSEQEPHNRAPGKMWESVNFVDSLTKGKGRRRGTLCMDYAQLPGAVADALDEATRMHEYTFFIDGREYSLVYRPFASTTGSDYFAVLLSKDDDELYPITYENSTWVNDLVSGGVSAIACVGRYVYLAGNTTYPYAETSDLWNVSANKQRLAAWVREGAFSRKFTLTLYRADNSTLSVTYETKASAYPELLDTTDIPFYKVGVSPPEPDPEYQKKINDAVNAYEGEKSAWIRTSAEDIVPTNIAQRLAELLIDAEVAASSGGPCVFVDDPEFVEIKLTDDGANTLVTAAGQEISSPEDVTLWHYHGKIVRVRPNQAGDESSYYLRAVNIDGGTGWGRVQWVESAGVEHVVKNLVSQLVIDPVAKRAYVAQDGAGLTSLWPGGGEHPAYKKNLVGDGITAPLPYFFGRRISCMTVFQDRLMFASDNMVTLSRNQDYLNFFRKTVLNIQANDPVEIFAHGSEGDIIRRAVMFERDLVLFGELRQYAISGRSVLTPEDPNINIIGGYEGGADAQPIASGNFLFFGKTANGRTGLHQMEPGDNAESTVVFEVSQELDSWLAGTPIQLLGTTMPNMVTYRTSADPRTWYVYRYADERSVGRVLSSWGKFQYAPELGSVAAVTHHRGDLFILTLRSAGGRDYWFADKLSLNMDLAPEPHLDSQVPYGEETPWHTASASSLYVAADKTSTYFLMGARRDAADDFIEQAPGVEPALRVGSVSPAMFQLTNPYLRDNQGQAILSAKITLRQYNLHLADTGGLTARVLKPAPERTLLFEGRVIGHTSNIIGRQPVFQGVRAVSVGRETRTCIVEIRSEDWQPLRVTGAEWAGQVFQPRARGMY